MRIRLWDMLSVSLLMLYCKYHDLDTQMIYQIQFFKLDINHRDPQYPIVVVMRKWLIGEQSQHLITDTWQN